MQNKKQNVYLYLAFKIIYVQKVQLYTSFRSFYQPTKFITNQKPPNHHNLH